MIRKVEDKDYEDLVKLVYQVHELHYEHRPDIYVDGNPLPKEYFDNMLNDENALNIVFEENGKIMGLLMAEKKHNNAIPIAKERITYFIDDIVVDNNFRRKGIGKALYEYLLDIAKSDNVDSIELNVWAFNKSALKFYESLGMTVKNMKLEKILTDDNVDIDKQDFIITSKVSQ